ncbi:hypothetical protein AAFF_G00021690 [Aldrovandia affinis]|uniref:Gap junction protein n=1 Tax=Aldrovandia affinis TaxID=143900 RepID=A0AAD7S789_9TELE|nr:hypothetical protein AAFF_G00021690 [Aldrovandia affinis]
MERPSAMEVLFITLNRNITIVGKVWLSLLVLLRALSVLLAGFPLYQDEQERFMCNTIQPGCANACYDVFSPLSLLRLWPIQLLSLCLPLAIFAAHVVHQVLLRIGLEAGFGAAHYCLFGFVVPKKFICHEFPCTSTVECFTSRPTEKSVMLNFMLVLSAVSLLLSIADLACAVRWCVRQRRERVMRTMYKEKEEEEDVEEGHYLSPSSVRADAGFPLTQDLVATFRKRGDSQSSADKAGSAHLLEAGHVTVDPKSQLQGATGSNTNSNNAHSRSGGDGGEREGGEVGPGPTVGTPRPTRSCERERGFLRPPLSPPQRGGSLLGAPVVVRAQRVGQRALLDTLELQSESSDTPERRAWV